MDKTVASVVGFKKLDGDWTNKSEVINFMQARVKNIVDTVGEGAFIDVDGKIVEALQPEKDVVAECVNALLVGSDNPTGSSTMSALRNREGHGINLARVILKDRSCQLNNRIIDVCSDAHRHSHIETIREHQETFSRLSMLVVQPICK